MLQLVQLCDAKLQPLSILKKWAQKMGTRVSAYPSINENISKHPSDVSEGCENDYIKLDFVSRLKIILLRSFLFYRSYKE